MLKSIPYRTFSTKLDKLLEQIPLLGKLVSTFFSLFEGMMLDSFRYLDNKYNIITINYVNRYIFKSRWGGRVVPLNKNISSDIVFLPTEEILEILNRSKVTGIGNCYCREKQRMYSTTPNCDHPIKTCIHIGMGKSLNEIPNKSENLKKVSQQEVIKLLEECDDRGLVHQLIYYPNPQFYYVVCNCCDCCCLVMSKFLKGGSPQMIKSEFIAVTDRSNCTNCRICIDWCSFDARTFNNEKLDFNPYKCFGCGICVSKCPENSIELKRRE